MRGQGGAFFFFMYMYSATVAYCSCLRDCHFFRDRAGRVGAAADGIRNFIRAIEVAGQPGDPGPGPTTRWPQERWTTRFAAPPLGTRSSRPRWPPCARPCTWTRATPTARRRTRPSPLRTKRARSCSPSAPYANPFAHNSNIASTPCASKPSNARCCCAKNACARLLTEAELKALRTQVDPHFLFNTLNTIADLISARSTAGRTHDGTARGMLPVRATTRSRGGTCTLDEELIFARQYLDIEQVRFGERLRVQLSRGDARGNEAIPSLLLQPLLRTRFVTASRRFARAAT